MPKKITREVRAHPSEMRAMQNEDGALRFEGYAAVFNSWSNDLGGFREKIVPGAFAETIGTDDIRCLWNHSSNHVLGRNKASTLELREDDKGLWFSCVLPDCQWAKDLYESVKRGDVDQCSFSFDVIADAWARAQDGEERTLVKVKLYDVAIVTYPAYPGTSVDARSADDVLAKHRAQEFPSLIPLKRALLANKEKELVKHD